MDAEGTKTGEEGYQGSEPVAGTADFGDDAGGSGADGEDTAGDSGNGIQADGTVDEEAEYAQVEVVSVPVELVDSWTQEFVVVNTALTVLIVAVFVCAGALCVQTLVRSFRW